MTKHREVLAQVALVALLAVTILLVVVALRPPTSPATAAGPRPSASGASAATTMSSGNPTSTTSSSTRTTSQPGKGSAGDLRLTLGPSGRIYRWTPGSCAAGGASLKISTDNAKTWTDRSDGLHALLDVDPAADRLTLVTADKSCRTGSRVSTDDGENWTTRTVSAYLWLPATDDRSAVRLGSNASVSVCPDGEVSGVRGLAASTAVVWCSNGQVRVTTSDGRVWKNAGSIEGIRTVAAATEGDVALAFAVTVAPGCNGVRVVKMVPTSSPSVQACVEVSGVTSQSALALAVLDKKGALAVNNQVFLSSDGLQTWTKVSTPS